jgi:hypothetical protein
MWGRCRSRRGQKSPAARELVDRTPGILLEVPRWRSFTMSQKRTELQREVVEALVATKAVDFDAVGSVLAKYGARAALTGDTFGALVHWRVFDICIPPDPWQARGPELEHAIVAQTKG